VILLENDPTTGWLNTPISFCFSSNRTKMTNLLIFRIKDLGYLADRGCMIFELNQGNACPSSPGSLHENSESYHDQPAQVRIVVVWDTVDVF